MVSSLWLEKIDAHRRRRGKETLLPAMTNTHSQGGPASFRPSEQYTKHKGTFETTESLTPKKAQGVHTTPKFEGERIPTSPLSQLRGVTLPSYFSSLSPNPTPFFSQPFHGERKGLLL